MIASDPYRLFFPLGWLLGLAGLLRLVPAYRSSPGPEGLQFHSIAMIEGFVTLYAFGFLFTFVPRRTKTAAPAPWQLAIAAVGPVGAALAAAAGRFTLAQGLWSSAALVVIGFAVSRLRAATAPRVPGAFVWVPLTLAGGLVGSALVAAAPLLPTVDGSGGPRVWALGRALLLQGMIPGLVIGVGSVLLPQLTRGVAPPAEYSPAAVRRTRTFHTAAAALFLASFPLEVFADDNGRAGLALRALVTLAALVATARIDLPPSVPGTHRVLLWLAAWMMPAGWLFAALVPRLRGAALHIAFAGGFALMTLAVSLHVALSHGGRPEELSAPSRRIQVLGALVLAALAARLLVGVDGARAAAWITAAAVLLVAAFGAWAILVRAALLPRGRP